MSLHPPLHARIDELSALEAEATQLALQADLDRERLTTAQMERQIANLWRQRRAVEGDYAELLNDLHGAALELAAEAATRATLREALDQIAAHVAYVDAHGVGAPSEASEPQLQPLSFEDFRALFAHIGKLAVNALRVSAEAAPC